MTDPTVEEALATAGDKLLAWNVEPWEDQAILGVYNVGPGEPERLAWEGHPEAQRKSVSERLRARGLPLGGYDGERDILWSEGGDGFSLWHGEEGRVVHGSSGVLRCGPGMKRELAVGDIAKIVSYAAEDSVERGIQAELNDGATVDVAYEMNITAQSMIGYSRNDLLFDSSWAVHAGAALAAWAGCPFEDRI
ncbi:MAG: hypothetical protein GY898_00875 [Proteobacteria bacterium]|nr:hypothetical protein [Pseudomonadota bacterium]